jgi:hypothetical protein
MPSGIQTWRRVIFYTYVFLHIGGMYTNLLIYLLQTLTNNVFILCSLYICSTILVLTFKTLSRVKLIIMSNTHTIQSNNVCSARLYLIKNKRLLLYHAQPLGELCSVHTDNQIIIGCECCYPIIAC